MVGEHSSRGLSPRVTLGRLALGAAIGLPGVSGPHPAAAPGAGVGGPDGRPLPGVTAIAAPSGVYDVQLRLIAALPLAAPLPALAGQVRDAVAAAARAAGLEYALGEIDVAFLDLAVREPR